MQLDLIGRTVTQALAFCRSALSECEDDELIIKTDSEAVKLNLYNQIVKLGLRCRSEREGPNHVLKVKIAGKKIPDMEKGDLVADRLSSTAFPAKAISKEEARQAKKTAKPLASQQEPFVQTQPVGPSTTPSATTAPTAKGERETGILLVLQTDQIGQRDANLGTGLLASILENIDTGTYKGLFLIHRGVRLIDPNFSQGRFLKMLLRKNLAIFACSRSLEFYGIKEVPAKIKVVPTAEVLSLAARKKTVWI